MKTLMKISAIWLVLLALCAAFFARNWPFVHDAPLMHYVVFLMDHGMAPYRQIIDMNLPGSYMMEWLVMHTFGGGRAAWFAWDVLTGICVIAGCGWIAGRERRAAGISAGALAYLLHLRDGPANLGQRDWVVAVLLIWAFGCIFATLRTARPAWMAGFGFLCCAAAGIKPPVFAILVIFLVAVCSQQMRRGGGIAATLAWTGAGAAIPFAAAVIFVLHWHAWPQFLETFRGLVPWYAGLQVQSWPFMLRHLLPLPLWLLAACAVFLCWTNRSWRRWEFQFLIAATVAGSMLFLVQRKGWPYHRYAAVVFLLLWLMLEVDLALHARKLGRAFAVATLAFASLALAPLALRAERHRNYSMQTVLSLQSDLDRLGGAGLSGHVQCLDMTLGGCINVLYRMRLVQATGSIYDFYLFPQENNAVTHALQSQFLTQMQSAPPAVIVLSSHNWPGDTFGYDQVARWPAFAQWLDEHYRLEKEHPMGPRDFGGYRIYVARTYPSSVTATDAP